MKAHLTDVSIKSLKPTERQLDYFCTQTKNFGVRVSPGGTKTFFVLIGPATARKRIKLGTYPDTSLKDARRAARSTADPPTIPGIPSVSAARDDYLRIVKNSYRKRSAYLTERLLTLYFKDLDTKQLIVVTPKAVYDALNSLPPSEANHAFGAFKTFLNWAAGYYTFSNPLQNAFKPHKETSRARILTPDELKSVWHTCPDTQFGSIVRALILSGQRRGEIAALQPEWINEEDKIITFPKDITKNGLEHTIPLTDGLKRILRPGIYYNGWGKHKAALDKASGVTNWTLHDLRRTFRSLHGKIGTPPHIAERLVNHVSFRSDVDRIYDRYTYSPEMRSAQERYENYVFSLLGA